MPTNTAPNTPYPITAPHPQSLRPAWFALSPADATQTRTIPNASSSAASNHARRRNEPYTRITATSIDAVETNTCAQMGALQSSSPRTAIPSRSKPQ